MMPGILNVLGRQKGDPSLAMAYSLLIKRFDEVIDKYNSYQRENFEPTRYLGRKLIEQMIGSSLREKQKDFVQDSNLWVNQKEHETVFLTEEQPTVSKKKK